MAHSVTVYLKNNVGGNNKNMKKAKKIVFISITAFMLVLVIVLTTAIGIFHEELDKFVVGYKEATDTAKGIRLEKDELSEQIQAEGIVLVKNEQEDKTPLLPLKAAEAPEGTPRVNVFGWASVDWVISGSGSGQVKRYGSTDFYGALDEVGVEYNPELKQMYSNFQASREYSINGSHAGGSDKGNPNNGGSLHTYNFEFSRLYEPDIDQRSVYSETILSNAKEYSDIAIVVIGRVSGESNDSPKVQYKRVTKGGNIQTDASRTYLEISEEEEHLLTYVGQNYEKVIVLINSTNVMELGFMETIPGLDACLVVATTGKVGTRAIPKTIYCDLKDEDGNVVSYTPSGKLADTYAYDLTTSSTYVDTGSGMESTHFFTNTTNNSFNSNGEGSIPTGSANSNGLYPTNHLHGNGDLNGRSKVPYKGVAYEEYREGIYVGYKWYETADELGFWKSDVAKAHWTKPGSTEPINGYEDVVQYPFGYGLSYTTFSWEVTSISKTSISASDKDETITIGVYVTNTGDAPGQDVVQLYFSLNPNSDKGIERASVNLLAFAKTQTVLQPGKSEYVELKFKVSDLASYDYEGKIISRGGYVLEAGTYTLSLRTDAHTLAGEKMVKAGSDTITYNVGGNIPVMEESQNRFTGSNTTDGVAIDVNSDPDSFGSYRITYLSRKDFEGTFPFALSQNVAMSEAVRALNLYSSAQAIAWDQANDEGKITFNNGEEMIVYEDKAINDLGFALGMDYDNPLWDDLLDTISKSEMEKIILHGYTKTEAISSIGKPKTLDLDGPNQAGSFYDGFSNNTGYSSIALAQTWNAELSYTMGLAIGKECAQNGINGLYGPGVNVHRSPFGGRNYEYYSEDALMSGIMCAKFVSAAKNRGVYCYLKHICLYESESNRDGMYTWVTEQALREIYLRPFEIAVKDGGSSAIMTSYGRIGAVWTGGSEALLTEVVRGEWGFKGAFLTDYADYHDFMNGDQMIRAGGDIWMDGWNSNGSFSSKMPQNTNGYDYAIRRATKNIVYMWLNALATNQDYNAKIESGEITDDVVVHMTPPELNFRWYIPVIVAVDVLMLGGGATLMYFAFRKPKQKGEAQGTADEPTDKQGE